MNPSRRYSIRQAIGRGSFGTVYRAKLLGEGGFSKEVALKILNTDLQNQESVAERLRDEARVLGLIRHRSILQVDGLVQLEGRWAVVMEYIKGIDLKQLIKAGKLPLGPALEITGEIATALDVAYHASGPDGAPLSLVHRDIKPSNIQITPSGEVKVLDFGIAKASFEGREAETVAMVLGSVPYMSPERFELEEGPSSDVYSLGVSFYEMVVGQRFGKTSLSEEKHKAKLQVAIHRLRGELGKRAESAILLFTQMVAFHPKDRPTAKEVRHACRLLRQRSNDPWLAEYCAIAIPPLLDKQHSGIDELTGTTLYENASHGGSGWPRVDLAGAQIANDASSTMSITRSALPLLGIGAGALTTLILAGIVLLVVGSIGIVLLSSYGTTSAPPVPASAASPAPASPAPHTEPIVSSPPSKPEPARVTATPRPTPTPAAAPPKTTPRRATPPPEATVKEPEVAAPTLEVGPEASSVPHGVVRIDDPEVLVELISGSGTAYSPGSVPVGWYDIRATFAGRSPATAGRLEVRENIEVSLECQAVFQRCRPR